MEKMIDKGNFDPFFWNILENICCFGILVSLIKVTYRHPRLSGCGLGVDSVWTFSVDFEWT